MTKKRLLITVIFALLIVALLIPAGAVLAQGDDPITFRVREWGFYYWPGGGIYVGLPAQELNEPLGTYLDIEIVQYGRPYGDIYPLAPVLAMRYYEHFWSGRTEYNRKIVLGEGVQDWASICYPMTAELLRHAEGDPYRLSIAWARDHGKKWWPIKTYYNPDYETLCIADRDITGIYSVVDLAYFGYPW